MANISAKNLSVRFPIFDVASRNIRSKMVRKNYAAKDRKYFQALQDLNFEFKKGDRVGIIGENGAGKSTLLRVLSGVYPPTTGEVKVEGNITSFFEVGVGMDLDATGYENIPLLMASRRIPFSLQDQVTADVEEFTQLGEALFRPLRTYSAGMRLRLAFSIATIFSTDILLMDEVIGVGDLKFRSKSKERIESVMEKAGILVIASHSNALLKNYCTHGIVLNRGKAMFLGEIGEAISYYTGGNGDINSTEE